MMRDKNTKVVHRKNKKKEMNAIWERETKRSLPRQFFLDANSLIKQTAATKSTEKWWHKNAYKLFVDLTYFCHFLKKDANGPTVNKGPLARNGVRVSFSNKIIFNVRVSVYGYTRLPSPSFTCSLPSSALYQKKKIYFLQPPELDTTAAVHLVVRQEWPPSSLLFLVFFSPFFPPSLFFWHARAYALK